MRVETELKLDFDDVLIRPKRSVAPSRASVDLQRSLHKYYPLEQLIDFFTTDPASPSTFYTLGIREEDFDKQVSMCNPCNPCAIFILFPIEPTVSGPAGCELIVDFAYRLYDCRPRLPAL